MFAPDLFLGIMGIIYKVKNSLMIYRRCRDLSLLISTKCFTIPNFSSGINKVFLIVIVILLVTAMTRIKIERLELYLSTVC